MDWEGWRLVWFDTWEVGGEREREREGVTPVRIIILRKRRASARRVTVGACPLPDVGKEADWI